MITEFFDRLKTLDRLIRIKGTGTPPQLAERLSVSESTLYDYLAFMKKLGAPIQYNKHRESYYYETDGGFDFNFQDFTHPDYN